MRMTRNRRAAAGRLDQLVGRAGGTAVEQSLAIERMRERLSDELVVEGVSVGSDSR